MDDPVTKEYVDSTASLAGLPVHGYRPQPQNAVDQVNDHKILEEQLLRIIDGLQTSGMGDSRWLAIARTDLEKGFMALNRAIFQPKRISLPEDAARGQSS